MCWLIGISIGYSSQINWSDDGDIDDGICRFKCVITAVLIIVVPFISIFIVYALICGAIKRVNLIYLCIKCDSFGILKIYMTVIIIII